MAFLTRSDTGIGVGVFDSVEWAWQKIGLGTKAPDYLVCAVLVGNEDCPTRIEFYAVNRYDAKPVFVWTDPDLCKPFAD